MKHLGDITKIHGSEAEPVNVVIGGSPCQDLSVAGLRAGLEGQRSHLFMDQIRIIKEMRYTDEFIRGRKGTDIRPRFLIWENVPGALSSPGKDRKGADFQTLLTEIVRVVEPQSPSVPMPSKGGQWSTSGCIYDELGKWSIAWRVLDAQFWGVPQRRRRIALVGDFGGMSAPEILFERTGMSGNSQQSGEKGEGTAQTVEGSSGETGRYPIIYRKTAHPMNAEMAQGYEDADISDTLNVFDNSESRTPMLIIQNQSDEEKNGVRILNPHDSQGNQIADSDGVYPTLRGCGGAGYQQGYCFDHGKCLNPWDVQSKHIQPMDGIAESLYAGESRYGGGESYVLDQPTPAGFCTEHSAKARSIGYEEDRSPTLRAGTVPATAYCIQGGGATSQNSQGSGINEDVSFTLNSVDVHAISFQERAGKPGGGKGILIQDDRTGALSTVNNQNVCAYSFDSLSSNSMKSKNPNSGCREVEVSKTLDCSGPDPSKNQGGIAVLQPLVYNGENITHPANAQNPKPGDPCHTLGTDSRNYLVQQGIPLLNDQGGQSISGEDAAEVAPTLRAEMHGNIPAVVAPSVYDASRRHGYEPFDDVCETVQAAYGTGGNNQPLVVQPTMIEMTSTKNTIVEDGVSPTLTARMGTGGNQVNAVYCMDVGFFQANEEKSGALLARQYKDPPIISGAKSYQDTTGALMASGYDKLGTQEAANDMYVTDGLSVVRRLTPKECERLQGFPDDWTNIGDWIDSNGKKHKGDSDSPRYKALGNSIALPPWFYVLKRLSVACGPDRTMASLFDGIGGFPLIWETLHGQGSCLWASEIEEFPIAVTMKRFNAEKAV